MAKVKIYGADWCGDTRRSLRFLEKSGVPFDYVRVEEDSDEERYVAKLNNGLRKFPTILIGDAKLFEPSDEELDESLRSQGVLK